MEVGRGGGDGGGGGGGRGGERGGRRGNISSTNEGEGRKLMKRVNGLEKTE